MQEISISANPIILSADGVFNYCLMQFSLWAAIQALFTFWSVVYPFGFRQLKLSGRIRYAHIISIVLAVVIPLPAAVIHLGGDGVMNITSSVIPCLGNNTDYTFYSFILPVSIIMIFTMCSLLFIIWTLFKVCYL